MSFLNPDKESSGSMKIHVRTYQWSGGEKKIDPNNPAAGKKAFAEIRYYEGSGQGAVKGKGNIPMDIAVIGQTFSVSGFDSQGTKESQVSYFSNETTAWGQPMKVYKRDVKGVEQVAEGSYKQVKDKLGKLIRCQHNVYFYDFERKCIDRFTFSGSSYGEWTDYVKQIGNSAKYTGPTHISEGEAKEFPTGVAIVPKFELLPNYTDAQLQEVSSIAVKMEQYEKYLESSQGDVDYSSDQTPAQYDEGSQLPDASEAAVPTDMADLPF